MMCWSTLDDLEHIYGDPLPVWAPVMQGARGGHGIDSTLHIAENAPAALVQSLREFL